jgi:predicted transcriptional regulator
MLVLDGVGDETAGLHHARHGPYPIFEIRRLNCLLSGQKSRPERRLRSRCMSFPADHAGPQRLTVNPSAPRGNASSRQRASLHKKNRLTIGFMLQDNAQPPICLWIPAVSLIARPYLGALELAVLEALWLQGALDAKTTHRSVGERRGISLNTVQSTLERLFRKGLLVRRKVSHAFLYTPAVQREELMGQLIGEVVETLSAGRPEPMLAAFVDLAAKVDEENLARLERLIAKRRAERGEEAP